MRNAGCGMRNEKTWRMSVIDPSDVIGASRVIGAESDGTVQVLSLRAASFHSEIRIPHSEISNHSPAPQLSNNISIISQLCQNLPGMFPQQRRREAVADRGTAQLHRAAQGTDGAE